MRTHSGNEGATPADYVERVNLAIDFIVQNLAGSLKLEDVARASHFSPFHFHRVFRSVLGETLSQFIKRQRLERALYTMAHAPRRSLTEIALECGFASSSDFSRSFKQRFGVPPSAMDIAEFRDSRRSELEAVFASQEGGPKLPRLPKGLNPDGFTATILDLPPRTVAYIRVLNPFRGSGVVDACKRLVDWAESRGFADGQWLGYMWEDPETVAMEHCRYDVGVVLDGEPIRPDGEVGCFQFPAMRAADVPIRGDIELEQRAIDWLYQTWLPQSGYEPNDQPSFESWVGRPFAHGYEHFELSVQLPVR